MYRIVSYLRQYPASDIVVERMGDEQESRTASTSRCYDYYASLALKCDQEYDHELLRAAQVLLARIESLASTSGPHTVSVDEVQRSGEEVHVYIGMHPAGGLWGKNPPTEQEPRILEQDGIVYHVESAIDNYPAAKSALESVLAKCADVLTLSVPQHAHVFRMSLVRFINSSSGWRAQLDCFIDNVPVAQGWEGIDRIIEDAEAEEYVDRFISIYLSDREELNDTFRTQLARTISAFSRWCHADLRAEWAGRYWCRLQDVYRFANPVGVCEAVYATVVVEPSPEYARGLTPFAQTIRLDDRDERSNFVCAFEQNRHCRDGEAKEIMNALTAFSDLLTEPDDVFAF